MPESRPDRDDGRALAAAFDLAHLAPDFYADPYPYYRALRQHAPVKQMPDGSWFLTRYDDILPVYRDPQAFSSDKKKEFGPKYGPSPLLEHHTTSLVFNDPPLHTRVRRAIVGALSQKHIAAMEPGLVALVDRLLDRLADEEGSADLIERYAGAIPVEIIGNLLGVPHADRAPLRGWSLAILGALEPVLTPERAALGNRAVEEFGAYLRTLIDERRQRPRDPDTDVLTRLLLGDDADALTATELVHQCMFLLNAGHETTTNLIGNALFALTQWPGEKARLLAEPSLIGLAVEEFLRYESSNQLGNRISTEPVVVGGVAMPADSRITLCIGAANRDPAQFPDPDRLDVGRQPNRHIAFGFGIHTCAGLNLARLEGRVAIGRFLARFPRYALAGEPQRGGRARFRGFLHLPVNVHGR